MTLAQEYVRTGLKLAITVQEWEEARGLPPYSVYPEAKLAVTDRDVGYFMYTKKEEDNGLDIIAAL